MKIKNTSHTPPISNDEKADVSTPKSDELNTQAPHLSASKDAANINRLHNSQDIAPGGQETNTRLPPPINLAHYAATGSIHPLQDKLLAAAEKILLTTPHKPAVAARHQVIDLVLKENFRTLLTNQEQQEIANTLKKTLTNDPVFCSEVDTMLEIAARKLEIDNQS